MFPDVLPVPTGLGKTEVALAWAWRLLVDKKPEPLHLVVCLPMRSLVTQTVVTHPGTKTAHVGPSDAALTDRQRAILRVLEQKPSMPLRESSAALETAPSDRRLREELLHLKQHGLVEQSGHGRGSSWSRRRGGE